MTLLAPPGCRAAQTPSTETRMQTIKKVLNSSVVLVVDERGVERVLLGRGIGFGAKAGEAMNRAVQPLA